MSVMRAGSRTPATSKIEFFVAIIKKLEATKYSPKKLHLRCYNGYKKLESISVKCHMWKLPQIALKSFKTTCEEVHI